MLATKFHGFDVSVLLRDKHYAYMIRYFHPYDRITGQKVCYAEEFMMCENVFQSFDFYSKFYYAYLQGVL